MLAGVKVATVAVDVWQQGFDGGVVGRRDLGIGALGELPVAVDLGEELVDGVLLAFAALGLGVGRGVTNGSRGGLLLLGLLELEPQLS